MVARLKKRWPTRQELMSWWIWHKMNHSPIGDFDDPDSVRTWLRQFEKLGEADLHAALYQTYREYRIEFVHPLNSGLENKGPSKPFDLVQ